MELILFQTGSHCYYLGTECIRHFDDTLLFHENQKSIKFDSLAATNSLIVELHVAHLAIVD
jgi:hypothetical protein